MSYRIRNEQVAAVLLADGWHDCDWYTDGRSTFAVDVTQKDFAGDELDGFTFWEGGELISGPWSAIQAVKYEAK